MATTTAKKTVAAKPAAKKAAAKPPAKKTPTKKAIEGGATSSTATPRKKAAGAGDTVASGSAGAPAPAAQANNAFVHWNDDASIPRCGTLSLGAPQRGNRNRDQATCPACLPTPGALVHVHPRVLLLTRNIRKGKVDPDFLASIAELGVLQPITAVVNDQDQLVVRYGERRVRAAVEAELPSVPVYVADRDDQADAAEVERIIRQRDENTHRDGLTAADDLHVVEQLVAFGIPADQVGARARMPQAQVQAAVKVSGSKLASAAAAKYEALTLDQVAAVAEFEADTETAKELIVTAVEDPDDFAHLLQRKRDEREEARVRLEAAAEFEEKGVDVVTRPNYDDKTKPLYRLRGEQNKQITAASHAKCPGHVVWIHGGKNWSDDTFKVTAEYGCSDPSKYGHIDSHADTGRPKAADMSEADREKAKKARKLVIDNNKAWDSALKVRRAWLAELATHKTPPAGTEAFIAAVLVENPSALTDGSSLSGTWTGVERFKSGAIAKATPKRALHIALMRVLAAYEEQFGSQFGRNIWRRDNTKTDEGRYLRFLESAGYPLSDVEKFAVSSKTAP